MSETLRLFIALQPDSGVQKQASREFTRLSLTDGLRITEQEQLHTTLKFWSHFQLGDLAQLLQVIQDVAERNSAITLHFNEPAIFGSQQARVLALQSENNEELKDLYHDLEETLVEYGLADRESRLFRPHLTLARVKDFFSEEDREKFLSWRPDITASIDELKLFSSELTAHGPQHDQMAAFTFQPNNDEAI